MSDTVLPQVHANASQAGFTSAPSVCPKSVSRCRSWDAQTAKEAGRCRPWSLRWPAPVCRAGRTWKHSGSKMLPVWVRGAGGLGGTVVLVFLPLWQWQCQCLYQQQQPLYSFAPSLFSTSHLFSFICDHLFWPCYSWRLCLPQAGEGDGWIDGSRVYGSPASSFYLFSLHLPPPSPSHSSPGNALSSDLCPSQSPSFPQRGWVWDCSGWRGGWSCPLFHMLSIHLPQSSPQGPSCVSDSVLGGDAHILRCPLGSPFVLWCLLILERAQAAASASQGAANTVVHWFNQKKQLGLWERLSYEIKAQNKTQDGPFM